MPFPRQVAPTLVDAVCALEGDTERGFVFVRPDGTERLRSFHDLAAEAARRAAALAALGLVKGDRVALAIPDGEEFVLSLLATHFAGLVPVPLYPQLSFNSIDAYHATVTHIARAAGAAVLLTTTAGRPYLEAVLGRVDGLRAIVTVDELAASNGSMRAPVTPDDLALIQFTSGSTSRPKGVMVTHGNLAANSEAFMIHGLDRDPSVDKGVSWLPLFHDMGLIGFVVGPLFTNVPCVFLPTASFARRPRMWLDKIHEHRGTITYAPNFAYALVAKRLKGKDVQDLDLSCLRISGCGAEPIQPQVLRDFAATLAPARFDPRAFVPSYGMAEATLAITFTPLAQGLHTDTVEATPLTEGKAVPTAPSADWQARSSIVAACSPVTRSPSSTRPGFAWASARSGRSWREGPAWRRATSANPSSPRRPSSRWRATPPATPPGCTRETSDTPWAIGSSSAAGSKTSSSFAAATTIRATSSGP